ncbi:putative quinol monooxygenase [Vibrio marisflavi]|uniref:ABM domain-containing protein n=1 Tax=Vibrio marisflavi CECT 7928 TaxID=634439 RepID=A0ABN8E4X3_9VIBR|nr:antibiotic biosynthesis monooxygenase [Vibrio marisflavi]CAH0538794.1 hypothetical protein VMF7928_01669 [Vibrio marisflavi CECT 7928]
MAKVIVKGFIVVSDTDLEVVEQALPAHLALTLEEEGCLCFQVVKCPSNANRFDVYEEFVDMEAFNFHQERIKDSHWGSVTKSVERHYTIDQPE